MIYVAPAETMVCVCGGWYAMVRLLFLLTPYREDFHYMMMMTIMIMIIIISYFLRHAVVTLQNSAMPADTNSSAVRISSFDLK